MNQTFLLLYFGSFFAGIFVSYLVARPDIKHYRWLSKEFQMCVSELLIAQANAHYYKTLHEQVDADHTNYH